MIASAKPEDDSLSEADATERAHEAAADSNGAPDAHPLEPLRKHLAELTEYSFHYLEARKDAVKAAGRRVVVRVALAAGAAVVAITVLATSAVMVLAGLAEVVGTAWPAVPGVGPLMVGSAMLLAIAVVALASVVYWIRSANRQTRRKYERRHQAQRAKFGRNVAQRASA